MPLFLTEGDVQALAASERHFTGVLEGLEAGFRDYASGRLAAPREERQRCVWPPGQQFRPYERDMRVLSAMVPGVGTAGVHIGCNSYTAPGGTSFMVLMDFERLNPLAIIEDYYLHSVRAGSPTGIAVRRFARPDAAVLGVIGSGKIARVQVAVACGQRPLRQARVYSPHPEHREAFARYCREGLDLDAVAVGSAREAVDGADVVTVSTNSYNQPVMDGAWLKDGALVASVTPGEMDAGTVHRSRVIVTSRNRIVHDYTPWEPVAGAVQRGEIDLESLPTLGDILLGRAMGRERDDQVIYFASPGIGFCDVVVARWLYDLAVRAGVGRPL